MHHRICTLFVVLLAAPLFAEEPRVLDLGNRRELFVDDFLIDKLQSAKLRVQQPAPQEVALTADAPWEGNTSAYYTILQDGKTFRMYYRGAHWDEKARKAAHRELACYAESTDGVRFTKPKLGLFEFNGSKENNIVWDGPGTHNFTPFKDTNPRCRLEARYKALASGKGGLVAFQSFDGIHWSLMRDRPVITKGAFDSQNLAFWDPHIGKYREYHRGFRNGVRDIMTSTSDDFLNWTEPEYLDYAGAPAEHLYTNAIRPYERSSHLLIGFPTRFEPKSQQVEPIFMSSRDGTTFHRFADAVIPRTAPKDRGGNRSNYMAWGVVQLPGNERELSVYAKEAYYAGPGSRVRRFTFRVDGFAALEADAAGGEMLSKPLRCSGTKLTLNYRARPGGSVRVEVQDEQGKALPGLDLAGCRPLNRDEIAGQVLWTAGRLKSASDQSIRLRIVLKDAQVFALRFE